ncbi:MAG: ketoacyl-ACP synthase III [Peptostreptococcaceae bacterium]|nr:ketoacyl-ACP synthase III [Peptostreptococcaceae bacterium]
MKLKSAGIIGIGSYLPEKIMTNKDLEQIVDTNDEWIRTRTGIEKRRIATTQEATSDLSLEASKKALESANIQAEDLDLVIVATITPDMSFPSTACIVQDKLGAKNAGAFDLTAACSGFIYGISIAKQFVEAGVYKNILVVGAETMTKILDWKDRNTCVLFGDGAGAVVISTVEEDEGIKNVTLGSDGSGGSVLNKPAGGSRMPVTHEALENRMNYLKMDGSEVFKFAVRKMAAETKKVLEEANVDIEDIDMIIPHQANIRIIEGAAKRLKVGLDKMHINLNEYGNMSAASIPVALDEAYRKGKIKKKDKIVLVGFGAGLTWGASYIKWSI